jgi:hypothetical protein
MRTRSSSARRLEAPSGVTPVGVSSTAPGPQQQQQQQQPPAQAPHDPAPPGVPGAHIAVDARDLLAAATIDAARLGGPVPGSQQHHHCNHVLQAPTHRSPRAAVPPGVPDAVYDARLPSAPLIAGAMAPPVEAVPLGQPMGAWQQQQHHHHPSATPTQGPRVATAPPSVPHATPGTADVPLAAPIAEAAATNDAAPPGDGPVQLHPASLGVPEHCSQQQQHVQHHMQPPAAPPAQGLHEAALEPVSPLWCGAAHAQRALCVARSTTRALRRASRLRTGRVGPIGPRLPFPCPPPHPTTTPPSP